MIRKLRRKFVLTNMLLVALVLLMVFAALVASNYQRLANQSRTALRAALLWSDEGPDRFEFAAGPPEEASRVSMVPVFTVTLDENGEAAEVMGGGNVSVSSETVERAVALAQGEEGVIPELDLRYLRETGPDGETRIAFADRGWERSTLWSMVGSFLLVGALALGAFFLISLLLSGLALRPQSGPGNSSGASWPTPPMSSKPLSPSSSPTRASSSGTRSRRWPSSASGWSTSGRRPSECGSWWRTCSSWPGTTPAGSPRRTRRWTSPSCSGAPCCPSSPWPSSREWSWRAASRAASLSGDGRTSSAGWRPSSWTTR